MLITSGGVSMGSLDLVKPLLERVGVVHFGRLCMKPGKPTTFATVQRPSHAAGGSGGGDGGAASTTPYVADGGELEDTEGQEEEGEDVAENDDTREGGAAIETTEANDDDDRSIVRAESKTSDAIEHDENVPPDAPKVSTPPASPPRRSRRAMAGDEQ